MNWPRAKGCRIAEVAQRVAAGRTSRTVVGTAEDVADELEAWFTGGAADGFVISPPFLPGGLEDFVDAGCAGPAGSAGCSAANMKAQPCAKISA